VVGNLTGALMDVFGSVAAAIVGLLIFRDDLRAVLRRAGLRGVPVAAEAADMIRSYLAAERDRGRIAADADVHALALTLIGTAHMMFADRPDVPDAAAVENLITTIMAGSAG